MFARTWGCVFCVLLAQTMGSIDRVWKHRMLDDAVRMFRGYKDLPPELADLEEKEEEDSAVIPTYMRELYFRYINRDVPTGSSVANTVRSINAEIGIVDTESMFIFNLSSVESTETFINSNIHVFKKRRRVGLEIKVTLYELAPYYVTELESHDISHSGVGWYTFSVSEAVRSCLSVRRNLPHILALSFTKTNSRGKPRPLHLKGFIRHLSRPFLVVYTNSSLNLTYDQVTARIPPREDLPNTFINPENGQRESFDNIKHRSRAHRKASAVSNDQSRGVPITHQQNESGPQSEVNDATNGVLDKSGVENDYNVGSKEESEQDPTTQKSTEFSLKEAIKENTLTKEEFLEKKRILDRKQNSIRERFIRSVEDNRLPEESVKVLSKDSATINVDKDKNVHSEYSETLPTPYLDIFSDEYVRSQYLPMQETHSKKHSQQKQRRRKQPNANGHSRTSKVRDPNEIPFPDEWEFEFDTYSDNFDNQNSIQMVNPNYANRKCGVKKMTLDFADIGWSEWIIEPKSFVSNFCAGSCSFPEPMTKGLSNHASLKSLLHAVGMNSDMPPPCCVPDKMTSQSVLYIDQNKNIVLKNYKNMAVSSCTCM